MKKQFLTALMISLLVTGLTTMAQHQTQHFPDLHPDSVMRQNPRLAHMHFEPGELLIRFQDDVVVNIFKSDGKAQTGMAGIDALFMEYDVTEAAQLIHGAQPLQEKQMLRTFTGMEFERPSLHNIYHLKFAAEGYKMFELIEALKEEKNIIYAEPNYIYSLTGHEALSPELTAEDLAALYPPRKPNNKNQQSGRNAVVPNDPFYDQQWWIQAVNADLAWDISTGDTTQVIAILDTGVDWNHPDLVNKIWTNPNETLNGQDSDGNGFVDDIRGWDFINHRNNPMDDNSHGTHVAGIAAAEADNGIGIAGVSWGAKIMPIKVLQSSGFGNAATITQGINYAANNGATVLNMSFTGFNSFVMKDALAYAYADAVLVAAAGNNGLPITAPHFPAALSFVLGVEVPEAGWSNYDHDGPSFSVWPELYNYELKAPGTTILSTIPGGNYRIYQGTSMAAPIVAGAMTIFRPMFPELTQEFFWPKLIQSINVHIDLYAAIDLEPLPEVRIIRQHLIDTIAGGDGDGRPDAGETIELWYEVRNTGGQVDSVFFGINFSEFEDTTTANLLISQTYLGSVSPYATRTNELNPFMIEIAPDVAHDRHIVFDAWMTYYPFQDTSWHTIALVIENGEELNGIIDSTMVLTPDKLWLVVDGGVRIGYDGHLIIEPGTTVIYRGWESKIVVRGKVTAIGTPDSLIRITGEGVHGDPHGFWHQFGDKYSDFQYCVFENLWAFRTSSYGFQFANVANSIFVWASNSGQPAIHTFKNNFVLGSFEFGTAVNKFNTYYNPHQYPSATYANWPISTDNQYNNYVFYDFGVIPSNYFQTELAKNNNLIGCKIQTSSQSNYDFQHVTNQYWGTIDDSKINIMTGNIPFNPLAPTLEYNPKLTTPATMANAIVWKVLVNGADAQDEYVEPVGVGPQRFDVYFNRPMDIAYTPNLTFGVRFPYNQHAVNDSAYWSEDSTVYTAYKTMQIYTGDGINRIRVSGARDTEGFEIPIEDMRFEFLIDAAGSASTDFMATPGMGKIELEWSHPETVEDLLGYNLYRFKHLTDTTFTNPILLNTTLVLDTLYTDFEVLPGTKYYYYYKILRTNLVETDSSRVVNGIPHTAALGDANGDYNVNILDITSIVSYILNNNPQPFIFEAADVNGDGQINLLDIIGVVNIIMNSNKSSFISQPATVFLETDKAEIESDGSLSGLQFQLIGKHIDELVIKNLPKGFEFIRMISGDTLTGILFNMHNKTLPEGKTKLFDIAHHPGTLEWGEVFGGNFIGRYVPVFTGLQSLAVDHRYAFEAHPNPTGQDVNLRIRLPENAEVTIRVLDIFGREVHRIAKYDMEAGNHRMAFTKTSLNLTSGVYVILFDAQPHDKKALPHRKEIKLVVM